MRVPVYTPKDDTRVLRRVTLMKSTDLPVDKAAHYRIRVGVQDEDRFSTLGEYAGGVNRIAAGGSFPLFSGSRALSETDVVALEVDCFSSPAMVNVPSPLHDVTVQVATSFRTALTGVDRGIASFLADSGALEQVVVYPLAWMFHPLAFADDGHTESTQTVTAGGSLENGSISVELKMPAWARFGWVHTTVDVAGVAVAAAGSGFVAVGESTTAGTTDHNEMGISTSTTITMVASTSFSGYISKTTTFRPRLRAATNNFDVQRQTIAASVVWT